jgi:uncharacterized membrane protein
MVLWAAIVGAFVGWLLGEFEELGFVLGGCIGAVFGWGMRRSMRAEVEDATATLRAQVEALNLLLADRSPPSHSVSEQPVTVPDRAQAQMPIEPSATLDPVASYEVAPPTDDYARSPDTPHEPGWVEGLTASAFAAARNWLFGGNTIVRLGLVVLFVGLSFLASYAASAGLFPIEWRLAIVALVGMALLLVGFRARVERPGFGLALQGGGVAIIYLTLFAAAKLYDTVPVGFAFAMMIVVCALGCALALLQRSQALAVTAFAGGFAVPLLLSDGSGDVAVLFGYYTILNLAVLFIGTRQSWRLLNLVGFVATFGVMALWETSGVPAADFVAAQTFLIASVLIYLTCALLYTHRTPGRLGGIVDTSLVFGPALAGFGLQVGLVHERPFGSAFAALGFAALYLGVATFIARRRRDDLRVMNEAMLAIGVGFITLAVPLALGARWTSAAWAMEGAGAFWVGLRQARWMPRLFGLLLQGVAALVALAAIDANVAALPLANAAFSGTMLVALAGFATGWWLRAPLPHSGSRAAAGYARFEARLTAPVFLAAFGFWWLAWAGEATRLLPPVERDLPPVPVFAQGMTALLAALAYVASAWGAQMVGHRLNWRVAGWPARVTIVALILGFIGEVVASSRVLNTPDWIIWGVLIGLHLRLLYSLDTEGVDAGRTPLVRVAHVGSVWLGCAMLVDCLLLASDRGVIPSRGSWSEAVMLIAGAAVLAALALSAQRGWQGRTSRWPLPTHAIDYGWYAAVPIAALLMLATVAVALFSPGAADPLPYLPLLNPADLSIGLALVALEQWRRTVAGARLDGTVAHNIGGRGGRAMIAALAFIAVNTLWLRVAHHLLGVAWSPDALLASFTVQTGIAILWTLLALALMVTAHRRGQRTLWLVGAGLLGITVAKLLLVDMNNAGGGERIIAFIVVGLLMLVVGYLAPLPPRNSNNVPLEGATT